MDFYSSVMGQPTITFATGTAADSGDNTIVAAPGTGKRLALLVLQVQNETSTATTGIVKFGTTAKLRSRNPSDGDGLLRDWSHRPVLLAENTALVLNLSGANSHGYSVEYATVPV
ncbi:MAG: hypothetical protein U0X20_23760 [Caldilineaceae bacterium]